MSRSRSWFACATFVLAAACGRLGYDPLLAGEADSAPNSDFTLPDGSAPVPVADAADAPIEPPAPFGPSDPIAELAAPDAADDDPSLTGDLLEIYFKSDRGSPGDFDIWRAQRDSVDDPWGPAERVDELSSAAWDETPEVSFDGLVLYFASSRAGGLGRSDIWLSTRASRADPWGAPVHVPELSSDRNEWAAVTDSSLTHVVITRSVQGHSLDLLGSSRASADQPWAAPEPLANLSTEVYEADGHLDAAGLGLFFAGELAGSEGRDIYFSQRPSPDADFAPPTRLVELSSASRDEDPWVAPDGHLIVFSSNRTGDKELFWAWR